MQLQVSALEFLCLNKNTLRMIVSPSTGEIFLASTSVLKQLVTDYNTVWLSILEGRFVAEKESSFN